MFDQKKVSLACLPTPLHELNVFQGKQNCPRVLVKRDDLTGVGFGGNKVRKAEYILAEVIRSGCDYIVTGAYVQSNWCTAIAAAANRCGIGVVLVKDGPTGYDPEFYEGNHLLHALLDVEMHVVDSSLVEPTKHEILRRLRSEGHRPFLVPVGGSSAVGALGYIECVKELMQQAKALNLRVDYLLHTSGSGGTQAGTIIGAKLFGAGLKVICASSGSRKKEAGEKLVRSIIDEVVSSYHLDVCIEDSDIVIHDQYSNGYGHVVDQKLQAIELIAKSDGLFLDPVYSSASMACLLDLSDKNFFKKDDVVVYLHTGGQAGLFPYAAPLRSRILGEAQPWTVPPWHPTNSHD